MRGIIIDDVDSRMLVDLLRLESLEAERRNSLELIPEGLDEKARLRWLIDTVHSRFHRIVVQWLQDQGARIIR